MAKSQKGSAFEREICTFLSKWWTDDERDDVFWRTAGSGARATVRGKKGKQTRNQCGDICAIDPIGQPFIKLVTLELKKGYSKTTLFDVFDKSESAATQTYEKWITQAREGSTQNKSQHWMIVHKRDRRKPMAVMSYNLPHDLQYYTSKDILCHKILSASIRIQKLDIPICVFGFYEFFKLITHRDVVESIKIMGL